MIAKAPEQAISTSAAATLASQANLELLSDMIPLPFRRHGIVALTRFEQLRKRTFRPEHYAGADTAHKRNFGSAGHRTT